MSYTKNTDPDFFKWRQLNTNCGSFAFNIEEWYDPARSFDELVGDISDWIVEMYNNGYSLDELADFCASALAEQVIEDFGSDVREVTNFLEVEPNEELIAFRTWCSYYDSFDDCEEGADWDFHFKIFRNGKWQEKCGKDPVRFCLEDEWSYILRTYNSNTIYFAHKIA